MEEVVGSIRNRSTIFYRTILQTPFQPFGRKFAEDFSSTSAICVGVLSFPVDRFGGCLHAFRNLLHVDIGRRGQPRVPQQSLDILGRSFLLTKRGSRSPDHLKVQLRQVHFLPKLLHPLPVILRVDEATGSSMGSELAEGTKFIELLQNWTAEPPR